MCAYMTHAYFTMSSDVAFTWLRLDAKTSEANVLWSQADGKDDLSHGGANEGDAGDPFPGSTGNTTLSGGLLNLALCPSLAIVI
jgi:hypothetical protein